MRVSAAGFTLLGLALMAATGCSSGSGSFASSRPSARWPWSKKATAESDIAQNKGNTYPPLPSQTAQPPQGAPNYYGGDAYAQTQPGYGYQQQAYGAQPAYDAQPGYGYQPSGTGLYDSQSQGAVAQTGGYPAAQPGYAQQAAPYGDPSAVNTDYYNSAYARHEAAAMTPQASPAYGQPQAGYAHSQGYGPADAQPAAGYGYYEGQTAAAPAAGMQQQPHAVYPEQVADSRYGSPTPMPSAAAQAATQPATEPAYGAGAGDRYGHHGLPADPTAASTNAGYYNEPAGFQPGATGYQPGANGFQPGGVAPYQPPAGPYNAHPNNPAAGQYRPGSTRDYNPPTSAVTPGGDSRTGSSVAPANYTVGAGAPSNNEVPAIYTEAMGGMPPAVQ